MIRDETPVEFFREQLEKAMEHQRVSTSAFTEFYLVNLLAGCVAGDPLPPPAPGYEETPLAMLFLQAMGARRHERARLLRACGDGALFLSGFFGDSLGGRPVDLGYYHAMGGQAYRRLSHDEGDPAWSGSVFSELAARFREFADVLTEVSEASRLGGNRQVIALYERWLQTGSPRAAALLAERGLVPVRATDGRLQ